MRRVVDKSRLGAYNIFATLAKFCNYCRATARGGVVSFQHFAVCVIAMGLTVSVTITLKATVATTVSGVVPSTVEEDNLKEKETDAMNMCKLQQSGNSLSLEGANSVKGRKSMTTTLAKFCNYCRATARGVVSFQHFAVCVIAMGLTVSVKITQKAIDHNIFTAHRLGTI